MRRSVALLFVVPWAVLIGLAVALWLMSAGVQWLAGLIEGER